MTIFYPYRTPESYRGDRLISDQLLPNLILSTEQLFTKARI